MEKKVVTVLNRNLSTSVFIPPKVKRKYKDVLALSNSAGIDLSTFLANTVAQLCTGNAPSLASSPYSRAIHDDSCCCAAPVNGTVRIMEINSADWSAGINSKYNIDSTGVTRGVESNNPLGAGYLSTYLGDFIQSQESFVAVPAPKLIHVPELSVDNDQHRLMLRRHPGFNSDVGLTLLSAYDDTITKLKTFYSDVPGVQEIRPDRREIPLLFEHRLNVNGFRYAAVPVDGDSANIQHVKLLKLHPGMDSDIKEVIDAFVLNPNGHLANFTVFAVPDGGQAFPTRLFVANTCHTWFNSAVCLHHPVRELVTSYFNVQHLDTVSNEIKAVLRDTVVGIILNYVACMTEIVYFKTISNYTNSDYVSFRSIDQDLFNSAFHTTCLSAAVVFNPNAVKFFPKRIHPDLGLCNGLTLATAINYSYRLFKES